MAGGMPVLIPRDSNAEIVKLDGIVLSGGADVNPMIHSPDEDLVLVNLNLDEMTMNLKS